MNRTTGLPAVQGRRSRLRRCIDRLSLMVYAAPDAKAREQGWVVKQGWGGLSREYRDPRFDRPEREP